MVVVVAIVAVLAALTVPLFITAVRRSRRATCAANLRQIGLAAAAYAGDNYRALPTYYRGGSIPFDTFWMQDTDGRDVNLGLLVPLVPEPKLFYCPTQNGETSPSIAYDTPANRWRPSVGTGLKKGPDADHGDRQGALNSSFPARSREFQTWSLPRWTLLNYGNKVIYSDFIGVNDWPGGGRFGQPLRAPHNATGCNRLFGDGSVIWADTGDLGDIRPLGPATPTAKQLHEYYRLLDVLP